MDIRIINREGEIMNISNLVVVKVVSRRLIGLDSGQRVTNISAYETEEEAKGVLEEIGNRIQKATIDGVRDMIIRLE